MVRLAQPRTWFSLALLLTLILPATARAEGLIQFSGIPVSIASSDFPKAFSGFGIGAGFCYGFNATPHALDARFINQGQGSLYTLLYRQYLTGKMWTVAPEMNRQDLELQVRVKRRSVYWEAGPAIYNATHDIQFGTETVSGVGVLASLGFEQPISFFLGGLRLNYMNTLTNSIHFISAEFNIAFPLKI